MKKFLGLIGIFFLFNQSAKSQNTSQFFIDNAPKDANNYAQKYLDPFFKGFSNDMNAGWYQTAKPLKAGKFGINFSVSASLVPDKDLTFDVNSLNLKSVRLKNGESSITPTVAGIGNEGHVLQLVIANANLPFPNNEYLVTEFNALEGLNVNVLPTPILQGSVGVGAGTEVMLRLLPKVNFADQKGSISLFGIGAKHSISQYLPGGDKLSYDLAVVGAFSQFNASYNLSLEPEAGRPQRSGSAPDYNTQNLDFKSNNFTVAAVFSKKISVLTLHVGAGYNGGTTTTMLKGNYPVTIIEDNILSTQFAQEVIVNFTDPTSLKSDGADGAKITGGFRLKLAAFTLHADYTLANYSAVNAGIGFIIGGEK